MALPFVLGLAVGAGVVLALTKSEKIKKGATDLLKKSKDVANDSLEKSKGAVDDVKQTINATAQCIKEKKEKAAISEKETITTKDKE